MKSAKDFMDEANAVVPRLGAKEAIAKYNAGGGVFVDVRDSAAIAKTGTIAGAHRIARGMLEFVADPSTDFHNQALKPDADIYLVCGAGGQAALAGKTLKDMGFEHVTNIGGIGAWKEAGGAMEG
ncbi:rhodanese-like domain-containing protein [Cognatiyoonia sp. IB215446]|uniref:rhodanese-like domain-containing protein n=1 Tax=Cognatiyoonia sp. IB215446 TaxID=3097355 RepID=UPI002A0CD3B4|nr:rhodanese-like domain-containing protein [Cognatiyoonia sp. IB215446]MDX8350106.1 rhodanese-like domain-containing protein [Cognatiyoonia sp. IB215446]